MKRHNPSPIDLIAEQLAEEKPGALAQSAASRILKRLQAAGFELRHYPLSAPQAARRDAPPTSSAEGPTS